MFVQPDLFHFHVPIQSEDSIEFFKKTLSNTGFSLYDLQKPPITEHVIKSLPENVWNQEKYIWGYLFWRLDCESPQEVLDLIRQIIDFFGAHSVMHLSKGAEAGMSLQLQNFLYQLFNIYLFPEREVEIHSANEKILLSRLSEWKLAIEFFSDRLKHTKWEKSCMECLEYLKKTQGLIKQVFQPLLVFQYLSNS